MSDVVTDDFEFRDPAPSNKLDSYSADFKTDTLVNSISTTSPCSCPDATVVSAWRKGFYSDTFSLQTEVTPSEQVSDAPNQRAPLKRIVEILNL